MNIKHDTVVDEFLVMRCQEGDEVALTALFTKWQPQFLRYATIMTRDPDLAADVLQDAWIKIIRALPGLREPLKFAGWAYRLINNQCLDTLRKTSRWAEATEPGHVSPFKDLETRDQVWTILEQLSPEHRSVLALHYLQGFSIDEIAEVIRKPQGTVKSRLHHAREKFRQLADNLAEPPEQTEQPEDIGDHDGQTGQPHSGGTTVRYRPA